MATPVSLHEQCPLPKAVRKACQKTIAAAVAEHGDTIYSLLGVPTPVERSPKDAVTYLYQQFLAGKADSILFAGPAMSGWPDEFATGLARDIDMAGKNIADTTHEEGYGPGRGRSYVQKSNRSSVPKSEDTRRGPGRG